MTFIPSSPSYVPQEYQVMYLQIDGNLMTEVQSMTVDRTDGGADVETLVRDYAGRVKGAAKATITMKGVVPYQPTDTGGSAFSSGGMVTGTGKQLDQTMLTGFNQNGNLPVEFAVQVGFPAAQQLIFKGFISQLSIDSAVGKQTDWSATATGQFQIMS